MSDILSYDILLANSLFDYRDFALKPDKSTLTTEIEKKHRHLEVTYNTTVGTVYAVIIEFTSQIRKVPVKDKQSFFNLLIAYGNFALNIICQR